MHVRTKSGELFGYGVEGGVYTYTHAYAHPNLIDEL